ncbi:hypothetical protein AW67_6960 [Salmonella enterica subsp. enterica serovar Montevideo str. USDA-ARS-USMARC-1903]|nr:hypothetical protein AW67_6960 [Salmonella enterica subsp. enterica serovar Montevideo str. USDA-ARS-USMARC-1903]
MDNIPPKAIAETINASTGFFIQAPFKYKNEGNQIFLTKRLLIFFHSNITTFSYAKKSVFLF